MSAREPTDLELLLVHAAGGEIRITTNMLHDPRKLTWTSREEPDGTVVFRVRPFVVIDAVASPVDEFGGL